MSEVYPVQGDVVELPLGQTAQPHKCGSCVFFFRRSFSETYIKDEGVVMEAMSGGACQIKLPPQIELRSQGEGAPKNWINDTGSCSFWKSTGKIYIEKHKVTP